MSKLVSITAPSGSGKTTLAGELMKHLPQEALMVQSYTTRTKRPSDLLGEYRYVSLDEFEKLKNSGSFLWTAEHGGTHYGTTANSIKQVFESGEKVGIMILVPEVIPLLQQFLQHIGKEESYQAIFIIPPIQKVLKERLTKRGDSLGDISKRLTQARDWLEEAEDSTIPYKYIRNDSEINLATEELFYAILMR